MKLPQVKHGDPRPLRHLGFTLIELSIVVVIVAILAAVAIPSYQKYVRDSRRQEAQQGLLTLSLLMERSFARAGSYPNTLPSTDLPTAYYTFSLDAALFPICVGAYLYLKQALKSEVPCDGNQQLL